MTTGNVTREAKFLILFDSSRYLPNLETFFNACAAYNRKVPAPKAIQPAPAVQNALVVQNKADDWSKPQKGPSDRSKARSIAAYAIVEKVQAMWNYLDANKLNVEDPKLDNAASLLAGTMNRLSFEIAGLLGERKGLGATPTAQGGSTVGANTPSTPTIK